MYKVLFSKDALNDAAKLKQSNLAGKCQKLIEVLERDPFATLPPYEKLLGDLKGFYSRRINLQHRLVYEVDVKKRLVKVLRMWTHYE